MRGVVLDAELELVQLCTLDTLTLKQGVVLDAELELVQLCTQGVVLERTGVRTAAPSTRSRTSNV